MTRSGTNTTSGGAYYFFRDDALNAKNYFERFDLFGNPISVEKAPFGQHQYGATLGGPVRRDRLFYFASIERQQIDANNFVTIDDETNITHPFQPQVSLGTPAQILRTAGFSFDTGHVPYQVRTTQWFGKLDQYIGNRQRLSVRVNGASELNENIEPFGGLVARSRAAVLDTTDVMGAVSHNFIATPQLVNEARFLVAWRDQTVSALDPTCDGPCDREDEGGPTIEVSGVASLGRQRFTPTPRDNIRYQFVDTLSYSKGRHLFKVGADVSIVQGLGSGAAASLRRPLHLHGICAECIVFRPRSRRSSRLRLASRSPTCRATATRVRPTTIATWRSLRKTCGRFTREWVCGRACATSSSSFRPRRSASPACRLHTTGRAMAITSRRGLA